MDLPKRSHTEEDSARHRSFARFWRRDSGRSDRNRQGGAQCLFRRSCPLSPGMLSGLGAKGHGVHLWPKSRYIFRDTATCGAASSCAPTMVGPEQFFRRDRYGRVESLRRIVLCRLQQIDYFARVFFGPSLSDIRLQR